MGLAYTPKQRYKTLRSIEKEWEKVSNDTLRRAIDGLYKNKLIDLKKGDGNLIKMTLLDGGKKRALSYKLGEINIKKPKLWDKKWRIVLFDIPKDKKKIREAFRFHLKRLGFYQYQKSVFVLPYECGNEIDFLIEFYEIRPYVRQIIAIGLDNNLHLKNIFKL